MENFSGSLPISNAAMCGSPIWRMRLTSVASSFGFCASRSRPRTSFADAPRATARATPTQYGGIAYATPRPGFTPLVANQLRSELLPPIRNTGWPPGASWRSRRVKTGLAWRGSVPA